MTECMLGDVALMDPSIDVGNAWGEYSCCCKVTTVFELLALGPELISTFPGDGRGDSALFRLDEARWLDLENAAWGIVTVETSFISSEHTFFLEAGIDFFLISLAEEVSFEGFCTFNKLASKVELKDGTEPSTPVLTASCAPLS